MTLYIKKLLLYFLYLFSSQFSWDWSFRPICQQA